jgi:hypothetical protein
MDKSLDIPMSLKMNRKCFADIEKLAHGEQADESQIVEILQFIETRYDCADFRMVCILRTLYAYAGMVSEATLGTMKKTVLMFKYSMDEPGEDSMCYWSENHQLLFASCEYLAGQLYPKEVFSNSGMTGKAHIEKAKRVLLTWLKRRFQFGFSEFHSNTYYEEDIAPLSLLIDFAGEEDIQIQAAMTLDLLLLDMALHNFQGYFCAASGRCYEAQKKDTQKQDILDIMKRAFGFFPERTYDYTRLSAEFVLNKSYCVPKVIQNIAHDKSAMEIRDSMGLDLTEVREKFRGARAVEDMGRYLWAMEAFTNHESVNMTMKMFRLWRLRTNDFLKDMKVLDMPWLRRLGVLPALVRLLNPVTQGIAIQRANTYTYKTEHYMLSTAQRHHAGEFGDQQHIWQATLPGGVTVFTTHPGAAFFEDNARNFSPSYWVGNGLHPDAAQYKNVCLCLYRLDRRKGFMEKQRQMYTHAYFPKAKFDQSKRVQDRLYIARKDGGYIALFSLHPIEEKNDEELIQFGVETGWAAVMGGEEYQNLEDFEKRMQLYELGKVYVELALLDNADTEDYWALEYRRGFDVKGQLQDTYYPRLDSPFGHVERDPKEYVIRFGESSLRLNLASGIREGEGV